MMMMLRFLLLEGGQEEGEGGGGVLRNNNNTKKKKKSHNNECCYLLKKSKSNNNNIIIWLLQILLLLTCWRPQDDFFVLFCQQQGGRSLSSSSSSSSSGGLLFVQAGPPSASAATDNDDELDWDDENYDDLTETNGNNNWNWDKIFEDRNNQQIIANGNIYPQPIDERPDDCLILVTRNQFMWHCPGNLTTTATTTQNKENDEEDYERTILYSKNGARFRGAFSAPGTEGRRLWLLDSTDSNKDEFWELDTVTGEILQTLIIEGSADGHDSVRVDSSIFVVDTRHGNIIECQLPASSEPYEQSSIDAGAKKPTTKPGYVDIIKVHSGFTRADHVNNVAIHSQLLISNLHGKGAIRKDLSKGVASPTRLSALHRNIPTEKGRELNLDKDGFHVVDNVGTWCHGIAFWDEYNEEIKQNEIKLISLDSKEGTMVSVVLSSGPNYLKREVLWEPDLTHPVLVPPPGIAKAYNNGAKVFSKGLAVQAGVAYFGVSFARAPPLRQTVPESLLVAVDLKTRKQLFVRTIRSNGLINQVLTKSFLQWDIQLPPELPTEEVTFHGAGGRMVEVCDDVYSKKLPTKDYCERAMGNEKLCMESKHARKYCCACRGGGSRTKTPMLAGALDSEALRSCENVTATVTFIPGTTKRHNNKNQCTNSDGITKHFNLSAKIIENRHEITSIDKHLGSVVKHICNLDVTPIQKKLQELGDDAFTSEYQAEHGNALITERKFVMEKIKPGTNSMQFIFCSKLVGFVYHFPWLEDWLPLLEEVILKPLGVPLDKVIRLMFANMPGEGESTINYHVDKNPWASNSHRVHIPIFTNPNVFFLSVLGETTEGTGEPHRDTLRIKSQPGEVYELNNILKHAVRNLGDKNRVHIILDWIEDPYYYQDTKDGTKTRLRYDVIKLKPGEECGQFKENDKLDCDGGVGAGAKYNTADSSSSSTTTTQQKSKEDNDEKTETTTKEEL